MLRSLKRLAIVFPGLVVMVGLASTVAAAGAPGSAPYVIAAPGAVTSSRLAASVAPTCPAAPVTDPTGAVRVGTAADLQAAINAAPDGVPTVIVLTVDINVTTNVSINIPDGKDITLLGDVTITGNIGQHTFTVLGKLTLAGPTVTHPAGAVSRFGVFVGNAAGTDPGELVLNAGTITKAADGLTGVGVVLQANSSFTINGGEISGFLNAAGPAVNASAGAVGTTITFNGGLVTGNTANGGATAGAVILNGAAAGTNGTVTLNCADISGNTATGGNGAGIAVVGATAGGGAVTATMNGGRIANNTATAPAAGGGAAIFGLNGTSRIVINGGEISGNANTAGAVLSTNGTLVIHGGLITGNTAPGSGDGAGVFVNGGQAVMDGGTISGNTAAGTGGGVRVQGASGTFTMAGGVIENNIAGTSSTEGTGGGVFIIRGATFTLNNGEIRGNASETFGGGGISNASSNLVVNGGSITGNTAPDGAGVMNWRDLNTTAARATFTMTGGTIADNATGDASIGGGVFNVGSTFAMHGGQIARNTATDNGGGVYNTNSGGQPGTITISGTALVTGNVATNGDGGGVYNAPSNVDGTENTVAVEGAEFSQNAAHHDGGGIWTGDRYQNLTVSDSTFADNTARAAFNRATADDALYAAQVSGGTWTGRLGQGYNNFDINYVLTAKVVYNGNGNTSGTAPTDPRIYHLTETPLVAGQGDLARGNSEFLGWARSPGATEPEFAPGDTLDLTGVAVTTDVVTGAETGLVTLYAVWRAEEPGPGPTEPGPGPTGPSTPTLPTTGLPVLRLLAAGALAIALGGAFVVAARSRRRA